MATASLSRRTSQRSRSTAIPTEESDSSSSSSSTISASDSSISSSNSSSSFESATPVTTRSTSSSSSLALSTDDVDIDTPSRASRLLEKAALSELNHRLEFYILRQREKDAAVESLQREIESLRKQAEREMERQAEKFQDEINEGRKKKEELQKKLTESEQKFLAMNDELSASRSQLSDSASQLTQLSSRLSSLTPSHSDLQSQIATFRARISALETSVKDESSRRRNAESALRVAEGRAARAEKDALLEQERARTAAEEYDMLAQRAKADGERMARAIHELSQRGSAKESEVRREFTRQLADVVKARQQQFAAEKSELIDTLKSAYEDKLEGYRHSLEDLGHLLEAERQRSRRLQQVLDEQEGNEKLLLAERDTLATRLTALEKQLEEERHNPELLTIVKEKNDIIRRIKEQFKRKDAEFDELMDVKIALDLEIRAYRAMLEQEERRLGMTTDSTNVLPKAQRKRRKKTAEEKIQAHDEEANDSKQTDKTDAHFSDSTAATAPATVSNSTFMFPSWFSSESNLDNQSASESSAGTTLQNGRMEMEHLTRTLGEPGQQTEDDEEEEGKKEDYNEQEEHKEQQKDLPRKSKSLKKGKRKDERKINEDKEDELTARQQGDDDVAQEEADDAREELSATTSRRSRRLGVAGFAERKNKRKTPPQEDIEQMEAQNVDDDEVAPPGSPAPATPTALHVETENELEANGTIDDASMEGISSSASSATAPQSIARSSLVITSMDLEGSFITIRNQSTDPVSLQGWTLRSGTKGVQFAFPSVSLQAGERFTVRTTMTQSQEAAEVEAEAEGGAHVQTEQMLEDESGKSAVWRLDGVALDGSEQSEDGAVWDREGDQAILVDPDGSVKAYVDILPASDEEREQHNEHTKPKQKNCVVM